MRIRAHRKAKESKSRTYNIAAKAIEGVLEDLLEDFSSLYMYRAILRT